MIRSFLSSASLTACASVRTRAPCWAHRGVSPPAIALTTNTPDTTDFLLRSIEQLPDVESQIVGRTEGSLKSGIRGPSGRRLQFVQLRVYAAFREQLLV